MYFDEIKQWVLHRWVDYHNIQPIKLEEHIPNSIKKGFNSVYIKLDDNRYITINGYVDETHVYITEQPYTSPGGRERQNPTNHNFIINCDEVYNSFIEWLKQY